MFASILLMLIYIICSALGLVLLKAGLNNGTIISLNADFLGIKFHILFICGTLLYIFSFLLNMFVQLQGFQAPYNLQDLIQQPLKMLILL